MFAHIPKVDRTKLSACSRGNHEMPTEHEEFPEQVEIIEPEEVEVQQEDNSSTQVTVTERMCYPQEQIEEFLPKDTRQKERLQDQNFLWKISLKETCPKKLNRLSPLCALNKHLLQLKKP